jgi:hypothetical protein
MDLTLKEDNDLFLPKVDNSWTELKIEIENCIKNYNLKIESLNINKWNVIEHRIINYFTGTNEGFTWMWEERILSKFNSFSKPISDFNILEKIICEIINEKELLWIFIEDTLNYETKYWGYEGKIKDFMKLLGELCSCDFYIISKKLEWVIGQNHSDVLFGYGKIKEIMETKMNENNI